MEKKVGRGECGGIERNGGGNEGEMDSFIASIERIQRKMIGFGSGDLPSETDCDCAIP